MLEADALSGESSHGATLSLYGADPDGNEFEIMWMLPRSAWGEYETKAVVERLDLAAELRRWSGVATVHEASPSTASVL
jgi:catechol-2,3-dioxygenase